MITLLIILFTTIVSYLAFRNREIFSKYMLNSYMVYHKKDYKRLLSHGFIHADWGHLFFNMFTLYFFGVSLESNLGAISSFPSLLYIFIYLSAIVIASVPSVQKNKNNHWYNSVGASGGVAAILFASILFDPMTGIYIFLIPIPIPGFIFGLAYLYYSHYMSKKGGDNINHEAHFVGALYGFTIPIFFEPMLLKLFFNQLISW